MMQLGVRNYRLASEENAIVTSMISDGSSAPTVCYIIITTEPRKAKRMAIPPNKSNLVRTVHKPVYTIFLSGLLEHHDFQLISNSPDVARRTKVNGWHGFVNDDASQCGGWRY
jgi:hypothetical protein